mmetsp:Transcript_10921/g.40411  ORF Transcript_10921/g.40411 Transcript_10921/m.40411 type:complete len:538 (-) Transcript_10921:727-2340(-)
MSSSSPPWRGAGGTAVSTSSASVGAAPNPPCVFVPNSFAPRSDAPTTRFKPGLRRHVRVTPLTNAGEAETGAGTATRRRPTNASGNSVNVVSRESPSALASHAATMASRNIARASSAAMRAAVNAATRFSRPRSASSAHARAPSAAADVSFASARAAKRNSVRDSVMSERTPAAAAAAAASLAATRLVSAEWIFERPGFCCVSFDRVLASTARATRVPALTVRPILRNDARAEVFSSVSVAASVWSASVPSPSSLSESDSSADRSDSTSPARRTRVMTSRATRCITSARAARVSTARASSRSAYLRATFPLASSAAYASSATRRRTSFASNCTASSSRFSRSSSARASSVAAFARHASTFFSANAVASSCLSALSSSTMFCARAAIPPASAARASTSPSASSDSCNAACANSERRHASSNACFALASFDATATASRSACRAARPSVDTSSMAFAARIPIFTTSPTFRNRDNAVARSLARCTAFSCVSPSTSPPFDTASASFHNASASSRASRRAANSAADAARRVCARAIAAFALPS